MHSRARKIPKSDSDFETLQRQLSSDFEVHLYLEDQPSQHNNTNAYSTLLNNLILHRRQRTKQLQRLKSTVRHTPNTIQPAQSLQLQGIEEMTSKQEEVKSTLEAEITQMKKSLNLLKGDIGHLVLRNESALLLGSKVNKAKIVAEDQLKRVALALAKDREEIKITNEMQKKFKKKLKNVSAYESGGLSRTKCTYIEEQLRKEEAYKKLLVSEKMAQNGEEMALLLNAKEQIDSHYFGIRNTLLELDALTRHFSLQTGQLPQTIQSLYTQINNFRDGFEVASNKEQDLPKVLDSICQQHEMLEESIKGLSETYEEHLRSKQELLEKKHQLQQEQESLRKKNEFQMLDKFRISKQTQSDFQLKMKKFTLHIKTLITLISFLQDKVQDPDMSLSSQHQTHHTSYVAKLHRAYQLLTSSTPPPSVHALEELQPTFIHNFYENMLGDIQDWLKEFQKQEKARVSCQLRRPHSKQTNFTRTSNLMEPIPSQSYYEELPSLKAPSLPENTESKPTPSSKAKRIQLLEDVDSNYYKMIKSTIKMQKQNTRKNYQFLRTFKRAKYASRDQILEEKRFEASFSVLFTPQANKMNSQFNQQADTFQQQSTFDKPFKTTHSSTHISLRKKQSNKSNAPPVLRKVRSSMIGEKECKTRLTQKMREALNYC